MNKYEGLTLEGEVREMVRRGEGSSINEKEVVKRQRGREVERYQLPLHNVDDIATHRHNKTKASSIHIFDVIHIY